VCVGERGWERERVRERVCKEEASQRDRESV